MGAELFHSDGRTDMMKLTVAFRILRTRLKTMQAHVGQRVGWGVLKRHLPVLYDVTTLRGIDKDILDTDPFIGGR